MKRLATLMLALCLTLGAVSRAQAIEVEVSAEIDFVFGYSNNLSFTKDEEDHTFARQRARIQTDFVASENLRGVVQLQFGDPFEWGQEGAALDTTSESPLVRRAYIDFNFPDSPVNMKMGMQHIALPSAVAGNPMFDAEVAGAIISADLSDNVALSAFWARPFLDTQDDTEYSHNTADAFGLVLSVSYENFEISPWFMYASLGDNSGYWGYQNEDLAELAGGWAADTNDLYTAGLALSFKPFDELTIGFDGMYGSLKSGNDDGIESRGWFVAVSANYETEYGVPGLVAWYSSGDDKDDVEDDRRFGHLPVLGSDGGFVPTRLGFAGSYTCGDDSVLSLSGVGTWGVALQMTDISFIEDMTHLVRVAYIQGTNDKDMPGLMDSAFGYSGPGFFKDTIYLTTKDKAFEVNFDTEYKIYDNLAVILELGWIHLSTDDKYNFKAEEENAYNGQITFSYTF